MAGHSPRERRPRSAGTSTSPPRTSARARSLMPEPLLELEGVEVRYGPVPAVRDLTLTVCKGEIVGLIGPNGAGKSTTLHAILGLVPARAGEIRLCGRSIRGRSPESIVRAGIALVP